ncbi:MAG TPA: alpha/beta hydrolase, partial [Acidobacteria bacterium]|nr:alpha/beta hydrolase [Acidobacteriota bacterium]
MAEANLPEDWFGWGSMGPTVHLAPANGFPPGTYRRFAEVLAERYRVVAAPMLPLRPGTDPEAINGWEPLAGDLRHQLQEAGSRGLVGVGHSLGAVVTAMAAAAAPELFRALVLVEPVLFTGLRAFLWAWTKRLGRGDRFFLARGAARRRDHWESREDALASWSTKPIFACWAPGVLEDYAATGTMEDPAGGVRLTYPKAWEARLFAVAPHDVWPVIRRLAVPVLVVRGT